MKMKTSTSVLRTMSLKILQCRPTDLHRASLHTSLTHRQCEEHASVPEPLILVEYYSALTIIGLNRPAKRNALNAELITALRKELKAFEANQLSSVAVLYGTGGNFCAGLDLDDDLSSQPKIPLIDEFCSKPVIASLNGYAVGEGFDLAMACDLRVMDDHAILGCFGRRFGMPMSVSATNRLSASVSFAYALELVLTGRPVKASEALERGLTHQVVACGTSKGNAVTVAQSLTKFPQEALLADRIALYQSISSSEEMQQTLHQQRTSALLKAQKHVQSEGKRFAEGVGKHGNFKDLVKQTGWPEWMS